MYDGLDRATSETNQLSHARTFIYDAADNLTKKTDRNGRVTEYDYDNLDRLTDETWIDVPAPAPQLNISTTTQGATSDEVQRVGMTVSGMGFIGGTFTLTYSGQTTSGIAYNASAASVQSALEARGEKGDILLFRGCPPPSPPPLLRRRRPRRNVDGGPPRPRIGPSRPSRRIVAGRRAKWDILLFQLFPRPHARLDESRSTSAPRTCAPSWT